ncbi:RNA guanine-N7 methyltransferase activating subunit-like isoform X2 [Hoplias malabaricus]
MEGYEQQFSSRFSERDAEFMERARSEKRDPPVIQQWSSGRRFPDGGYRGGRRWAGGPPQRWRTGPEENQYNSANQRPRYHRY